MKLKTGIEKCSTLIYKPDVERTTVATTNDSLVHISRHDSNTHFSSHSYKTTLSPSTSSNINIIFHVLIANIFLGEDLYSIQ